MCIKLLFRFINSIILLTLLPVNLLAAEKMMAKEPWAQSISMKQSPGMLETISAGSQQVTMVWLKQQGKANGSIILLHDINQNPDWQYVIKPLRTTLPRFGWTSISVPLPAIPEGADDKVLVSKLSQLGASIQAASTLAQSKTKGKVILLGYGTAARLAVSWLSKTPDPAIAALIIVSMPNGKTDSSLKSNNELLSIKIPVLDLIAEKDKPAVLLAAKDRWQQRSQLKQYRQIEINATGQFYSQQEDELVKRIRGWLTKTFNKKTGN